MPNDFERLRAAFADRYPIERELGSGGMATVYLARDLRHDRQVAIKVMHPDLAFAVGTDRFLREIRVTSSLNHPHILQLLDSGEAGGFLYYVMPYIQGESLRQRLDRDTQLPIDAAIRLVQQVTLALEHAHEAGVVHRDIKPENILLSGDQALVADFGIARAVSEAGGEKLTGTGLALGTPAYMSPEQCAGLQTIDGRSDIYSLGCVLYEMLAGEPPFTGRTPQAVIARHQFEEPRSLQVIRRTVHEGLERVIETALAKVPADRYQSARAFGEALAAPDIQERRRPRPRFTVRKVVTVVGVAAVAVVAVVLGRRMLVPAAPLDPSRVVIFPVVVGGGQAAGEELGENATLALVTALNSTAALRVVDGWKLLDSAQRADVRGLSASAALALARAQRAGWYIDGRLLVGDSVRASFDLHAVAGDSVAQQAYLPNLQPDGWSIGLAAARSFLPTLIPTGAAVDLASLTTTSPAAMASFLNGERAYRRAHFADALELYRDAVGQDSLFAVAALRGAQAARWVNRNAEASALVTVALAHRDVLNDRYLQLALGLQGYTESRADDAVRHFQQAIALDPDWAEAWMGLGEVYRHLLPHAGSPDSVAAAAFAMTLRLDPTFAPAIDHEIEFALQRGDVAEADRLLARFRAVHPDSSELARASLMVRCVRGTPAAIDWPAEADRAPAVVSGAAQVLAAGGYQLPCAEAAWRAVYGGDSDVPGAERWGAFVGLQGLLLAEGRTAEARELLAAGDALGAGRDLLYLLDASAGAPFTVEARPVAQQLQSDFRAGHPLSDIRLWFLGTWQVLRGDYEAAGEVVDSLTVRADSTGGRVAALMAGGLHARVLLARGDTSRARALLATLSPSDVAGLTWDPWQALVWERYAVATVQLAEGKADSAVAVASTFDSPASVLNLLYLPASLELRIRAAEQLGDTRLARRSRERLAQLRGVTEAGSPR